MSFDRMTNREVKRAWVNALRSGEYEQTTESLRNMDRGYCCLGVLCDLGDRSLWDDCGFYLGQDDFPPDRILTWAGLTLNAATFLADMNDKGSTFEDIAGWIERKL